jgi:hypothetical protein
MDKELLTTAKNRKSDEFYTQLTDIEKEMKFYKEHFRDKVVFMNCDDPYESDFFKYFALNFNYLGLRKIISTSYAGSAIAFEETDFFLKNNPNGEKNKFTHGHKVIINKVNDSNNDGSIDLFDIVRILSDGSNEVSFLEGDGDFRSQECQELLKEADIVVTNPPFSLFREYLEQLYTFDKKFLIIGNQNAITYQQVFPLIKENKLWLGITMNGSNRYFRVPDSYPLTESTGKIENGKKYSFVKSVVWFTNLKNKKWVDELTSYKRYSEDEYIKYDNFDAIDLSKVSDIPYDYNGVMGVPITFLHKYNPNQFEIIGLGNSRLNFTPTKVYGSAVKVLKNGDEKDGGAINSVLVYKTNEKPNNTTYYYDKGSEGFLIAPYARLLIRRKNGNN